MRILIVIFSCLAAVSHAQFGRTLGRRIGVRRMLTRFGALPVPVVKEYVGVPVSNGLLNRRSAVQYAAPRNLGYNRAMMADQYDPQGSYDVGYGQLGGGIQQLGGQFIGGGIQQLGGQFGGGIQQLGGQFNGGFQQGGYYNGYDPMENAVDTPDYIERRRQRRGQSHLY